MPVAPYSACEISWYIWENPVVVLCGVVPVTAIVPTLCYKWGSVYCGTMEAASTCARLKSPNSY